jgi:hypothetical protein
VGDATRDVDWYRPRGEVVPAALVDTYDNGASASDDWFVALGEDRATPELAIGRFPARTKEECRSMVERTIRYETSPERGEWRRRISFLAGEGRFGEAVDRAIEGLATSILNDFVPQSFTIDMTYASASSPYCYVPAKLTEKVIERMNAGAAVLCYTGHGMRGGFDSLRYRGKDYPIFLSRDVPKIKCGARAPLVFITACWTGCFDDPEEEPVGELLFENPQGAVAVFAASRISHPFANAVLSKDLVAGLFQDFFAPGEGSNGARGMEVARRRRLGEALVETKRRFVAARDHYRQVIDGYGALFLGDPYLLERLLLENMHIYNLLGDPALVPSFPDGAIALEPGALAPGKRLAVEGRAPGLESGSAIVTLEVERAKFKKPIEPVDPAAKDAEKRIARNYDAANDKVVARAGAKVEGGRFRVEFAVPEDLCPGKYFVKAYASGPRADAAGACEVQWKAEEASPPKAVGPQ